MPKRKPSRLVFISHSARDTSLECFEGVLVSGAGEGAYFVGLDWVRKEIRRVAGFDPYPGTLNLRLLDADALPRWSWIRRAAGAPLTPPEPGSCGGRLIAAIVGGLVQAAVVVPEITRYGDDLLEIVAPVHLRTRLGLRDGEMVRLTIPRGEQSQWPKG